MYPASVRCFVVEPTDLYNIYLRIYDSSRNVPCSSGSYHDGRQLIETRIQKEDALSFDPVEDTVSSGDFLDHSDTRWPKSCSKCGHAFQGPSAVYQYFPVRLYRSVEEPKLEWERDSLPPGALYRQSWLEDSTSFVGADGQSWAAVLPNGNHWMIDGRASNCDKQFDKFHKCWCRHGEAPKFTVDKNGLTCNAGAGSIVSGDYHGFLRDGHLVIC